MDHTGSPVISSTFACSDGAASVVDVIHSYNLSYNHSRPKPSSFISDNLLSIIERKPHASASIVTSDSDPALVLTVVWLIV